MSEVTSVHVYHMSNVVTRMSRELLSGERYGANNTVCAMQYSSQFIGQRVAAYALRVVVPTQMPKCSSIRSGGRVPGTKR